MKMKTAIALLVVFATCWAPVIGSRVDDGRHLLLWRDTNINIDGGLGGLGFSVSGTNPLTGESKSISLALAAGGGQAESASVAQAVGKDGEEAVAQSYAQAITDGRSGAVALSIAKSSAKGGEEAQATSKVIARTFGKGNSQAFAGALGEAYSKDKNAVAKSLADAIVVANGAGSQKAVAEATASAYAQGGNSAQAFSQAYAQAVSEGKCEQVAESFAESLAIAQGRGQGQAVASAFANADAQVVQCAFKECKFKFCCQNYYVSQKKECACNPLTGRCAWKLFAQKPVAIWEVSFGGWARNRYCRC